jgi:hypothetical protein
VDEAKMLENLPGEAGVEDRAVADLREGESVWSVEGGSLSSESSEAGR